MRKRIRLMPVIAVLFLFLFTISAYAEDSAGGEGHIVPGIEDTEVSHDNLGIYLVNPDTNYQLVIEDDAHLLDGQAIGLLQDDMAPLSAYGHVVFKSITENPFKDTFNYGADYYYSHLENENGVMLIIDMDIRQIYVIAGGEIFNIITEGKADSITDNIYTYAARGDYYACAKEAFAEALALLQGERIAEPMKNISNALIAALVAMFINFVIVHRTVSLKAPTKTEVDRSVNAYVRVGSLQVTHLSQNKRYEPQEHVVVISGGGGGHSGGGFSGGGFSGGGGHSGGGFSGGGGGHSF